MKRMRCVLLAISLVSGAAVAQGNGGVINGDIHLTSARSVSPVQAAAQQGLVRFATQFVQRDGQLPAGFPLALGNASALAGLRLGLGFQVYDISGSALAGRAKLEDMAIANGTWRAAA